MIHTVEVDERLKICPRCAFPFCMNAKERISLVADKGTFKELFAEVAARDIIDFVDSKSYKDRLEAAKKKTRKVNAITAGVCSVVGESVCLGVMDFAFMGGSLGRGEGEKLTLLIEYATKHYLPLVIVCASGGARMQESMYSLMQMAKTSAALKNHGEKGLFYLSVLTNPTMGGVSASFAFLGDVIIAEPKALIGFAGPRVIQQTIGQKLKEGDQKSEFQLEHGMIDQVVKREELKNKIAYFVKMFSRKGEIDDRTD